jgi:hypothetical protein
VATVREIPARRAFIAAVSACGMTRAAVVPRSGQTAPKMQAEVQRVSRGARGRLPRRARMRVGVPCWPIRASS